LTIHHLSRDPALQLTTTLLLNNKAKKENDSYSLATKTVYFIAIIVFLQKILGWATKGSAKRCRMKLCNKMKQTQKSYRKNTEILIPEEL